MTERCRCWFCKLIEPIISKTTSVKEQIDWILLLCGAARSKAASEQARGMSNAEVPSTVGYDATGQEARIEFQSVQPVMRLPTATNEIAVGHVLAGTCNGTPWGSWFTEANEEDVRRRHAAGRQVTGVPVATSVAPG